MTRRMVLLVVLLNAACASSRDSATTTHPTDETHSAVWRTDEDANVAYPTCWHCGAVADRNSSSCSECGAKVTVEQERIVCPECKGSKTCSHCREEFGCVACAGTHICPICDGTGKWKAESCPRCEGDGKCRECEAGTPREVCDRCSDTHVCANCQGTGAIVLR